MGNSVEKIWAYTDVDAPAMLVFGLPPTTHAAIATMTFTGTTPDGSSFAIYTSCGGSTSGMVKLDDRCSTSVDVLAVSYSATGINFASWTQPIANYQVDVTAELVGPVEQPGTLPQTRLPGALAQDQPGADFKVEKQVSLLRITSPGDMSPQWIAELAGNLGTQVPGGFHGTVAVGGSTL
jgi:hypothetical protein